MMMNKNWQHHIHFDNLAKQFDHPIIYASRLLFNPIECNYTIIEQETLAMFMFCINSNIMC
jgi:hypothetical protein